MWIIINITRSAFGFLPVDYVQKTLISFTSAYKLRYQQKLSTIELIYFGRILWIKSRIKVRGIICVGGSTHGPAE